MTDRLETSRRQTLKVLAGAPLLPLAGSAAGSFLFARGAEAAAAVASTHFGGMAAPSLDNPAAMASTTVGSSMTVKFADGTEQNYKLEYDQFFVTGTEVPDGKGGKVIAGGYYDINGKPILDASSK